MEFSKIRFDWICLIPSIVSFSSVFIYTIAGIFLFPRTSLFVLTKSVIIICIILNLISILSGIIVILFKSKFKYKINWWMVIVGLILSFIQIIQEIASFILLEGIKNGFSF